MCVGYVERRLAVARPRQLGRRSWRFVFTPEPNGGYFFKADGDLGLLLQVASPAGFETSCMVAFWRRFRAA